MGTVDKLQGTKNTLENFVKWLRATGGLPSDETMSRTIEDFLTTQCPGDRYMPACGHCGSPDVKPGDFRDEKTRDRLGIRSGTPDPASHGPAWVCQVESCGAYTPREETDR